MNPSHKRFSFVSVAFDKIGDVKLPTVRWLEHFQSYIFSVKALVIACAMVATFLTGCATTDDSGRPLSANGQPLQLQMIRVSTTSESQTFYGGMVLPNFAETVARGGVDATYNGPERDIDKKYVPKDGESFLIVEFKISGVLKTLQLLPEEGYIVDGKGGLHKALGAEFPPKWYPFSSMTISPENSKADQQVVSGIMTFSFEAKHRLKYEKWIFSLPKDSVSGATLHFQEKSYPLEINK